MNSPPHQLLEGLFENFQVLERVLHRDPKGSHLSINVIVTRRPLPDNAPCLPLRYKRFTLMIPTFIPQHVHNT